MSTTEPEKCVAGTDPNRCAYGSHGASNCAEECLVAKGQREYPGLRADDLTTMTPGQVAEVRAQRR